MRRRIWVFPPPKVPDDPLTDGIARLIFEDVWEPLTWDEDASYADKKDFRTIAAKVIAEVRKSPSPDLERLSGGERL